MFNQFDMTARRNEAREEGYLNGLREGHAEGKDVGSTEMRNNVRDAVDNSKLSDRITRGRLNSYLNDSIR